MKTISTRAFPSKSKMRVYDEAPKTNQTTHWDFDYMTNAEIEALLDRGQRKSVHRKKVRLFGMILGLFLLILIALVVYHSEILS